MSARASASTPASCSAVRSGAAGSVASQVEGRDELAPDRHAREDRDAFTGARQLLLAIAHRAIQAGEEQQQPAALQLHHRHARIRLADERREVDAGAGQQFAHRLDRHAIRIAEPGGIVHPARRHLDGVREAHPRRFGGAVRDDGGDGGGEGEHGHHGGDGPDDLPFAAFGFELPLGELGQRDVGERRDHLEPGRIEAVAFGTDVGSERIGILARDDGAGGIDALKEGGRKRAVRRAFGIVAARRAGEDDREDPAPSPERLELADLVVDPLRPGRGRTAQRHERVRAGQRRVERGAEIAGGVGVRSVAEQRRQPLRDDAAAAVGAAQRFGNPVVLDGPLKSFAEGPVRARVADERAVPHRVRTSRGPVSRTSRR